MVSLATTSIVMVLPVSVHTKICIVQRPWVFALSMVPGAILFCGVGNSLVWQTRNQVIHHGAITF